MPDLQLLSTLLGEVGTNTYKPRDYSQAAKNVLGINQMIQFPRMQETVSREFASGNPNKDTILGAVAGYDPLQAMDYSDLFRKPSAGTTLTAWQEEQLRLRNAAGQAAEKIEKLSMILNAAEAAGKEQDPEVLKEWTKAHNEYTSATGNRYTGGYQSRMDRKYLDQQGQERRANELSYEISDIENKLTENLQKGIVDGNLYRDYQAKVSEFNNLAARPWTSSLKDRLDVAYASANQEIKQGSYDLSKGEAVNKIINDGINRYETLNKKIISGIMSKAAFDANVAAASSGNPSAQQVLVKSLSQIVEPGLAVLQGEAEAMSGNALLANNLQDTKNSFARMQDKAASGMLTSADITNMKVTATSTTDALVGARVNLAPAVNNTVRDQLRNIGMPDDTWDVLTYGMGTSVTGSTGKSTNNQVSNPGNRGLSQ